MKRDHMKLEYRDSTTEIYTNAAGDSAGIVKDRNGKYYHVITRKNGEKGNTIGTRCTYENAVDLASNFLK